MKSKFSKTKFGETLIMLWIRKADCPSKQSNLNHVAGLKYSKHTTEWFASLKCLKFKDIVHDV